MISRRNLVLPIAVIGMLAMSSCAPRMYVRETSKPFPETMADLQNAIVENGYQLSRVQRVDYGLINRGFKSDKYRIVFFGKAQEISQLSDAFPQLIPFLPLKFTILEKENGSEIAAINPVRLAQLYPEPELQPIFERWQRDVVKILDDATRKP